MAVVVFFSLFLVSGSVFAQEEKGYSFPVSKLSAELLNDRYINGVYEGVGYGHKTMVGTGDGRIVVEVTVTNEKITNVVVKETGESGSYWEKAKEEMLKRIIEKGSTDVDTVTSATNSSKGIIEAVEDALKKAKPTDKAAKVVVSVEGQTLSQGFYIEPKIISFEEFQKYWEGKGQIVASKDITAGGMLAYTLEQNGTPANPGSELGPAGPGYLSGIKGIDKGNAKVPDCLTAHGVEFTSGNSDDVLSQFDYTVGSGWMYTEGNVMSDQAMASHKLYTYGKPYAQAGDSYYVVRLQFTISGLGADLGFNFGGAYYGYDAADKSQLYILFARLSEEGFFDLKPEAKETALTVMNQLDATQEAVDQAYNALEQAAQAEIPQFTKNLSEDEVFYQTNEAQPVDLAVQATVQDTANCSLSYEWFKSQDRENWVSMGKGSADNVSVTPDKTLGTTYYKCTVSNFDQKVGRGATVDSKIARITFGTATPVLTMNLNTEKVSYAFNAEAAPLTVKATASDGGQVTYQWYSKAGSGEWTVIADATEASYTPLTNKPGTVFYKCTATNTKDSLTSAIDSKTAVITVDVQVPAFTQNLRTTTQKVDQGSDPVVLSVEAKSDDGGTITYQWYSGSNTLIENMKPIDGAVESTYSVPTDTIVRTYFRVKAINTIDGTSSEAISNWTAVNVESKVKQPRFTTDLPYGDLYYLIKDSDPDPLTVEATGQGGNITYQWYRSDDYPYGTQYMDMIDGATENTYVPDVSKGGTAYYMCKATNSDGVTSVSADSSPAKVVVSCERPQITKNLSGIVTYDQNAAANPLTVEATAEGSGTLSYQWYMQDSPYGMKTAIDGATEANYTPPTDKIGNFYYTVDVTNSRDGLSNTVSSGQCQVKVVGTLYINTEEELRSMQSDGKYILNADITLTQDWAPINSFTGVFDGNGHVIKNVNIVGANSYQGIGFFGSTANGAVIQNLGLEGSVENKGYCTTGGLIGQTQGDVTISNCYVNMSVKGLSYYDQGGLVGTCNYGGLIENSYTVLTAEGGKNTGGIVGAAADRALRIQNTYTTWNLSVGEYKIDGGAECFTNNYCAGESDKYASVLPESMDTLTETLGDAFATDSKAINNGYPVLIWQNTEKPDEADKTAAQAVMDKINALPESITLEDEADVTEVKAAYDALTDTQKALVSQEAKDKLEQAVQTIADFKTAANAVTEKINALPKLEELTISEAHLKAVQEARTAYNALSDAQKQLVTNEAVLKAAEGKQADMKKAEAVTQQIEALGSISSLDQKADVEKARAAYQLLESSQKDYVSQATIDILKAAEAAIEALVQAAEDQAVAQTVIDQIENLKEITHLEQEADITAARTAYEKLTEAQKACVTNLSVLEAAETTLADIKAAKAVTDQIQAIGPVTLESEPAISEAQEAYDKLTDIQKGYVSEDTQKILSEAHEKLARLKQQATDQAAAKAVSDQIAALPEADKVTLEDKEAVEAARGAYNALTEAQQKLVSNIEKLEAAEAQITKLEAQQAEDQKAAQAVSDQIAALPETDKVTLEDKEAVEAARKAYDSLSVAQRSYVSEDRLKALEAAEAQIAKLEAGETPDPAPTPTPDPTPTPQPGTPGSGTGSGSSGTTGNGTAGTGSNTNTGIIADETNSAWACLALLAAIGFGGIAVVRRRRKS